MSRFVAVPKDWTSDQIESYQAEVAADGYTIGLSESKREAVGEERLPFVWEEPDVPILAATEPAYTVRQSTVTSVAALAQSILTATRLADCRNAASQILEIVAAGGAQ